MKKDVARILQVNKDTICNWKNNHKSPELVYLPKIIDLLGYAPYFGPCCSRGEKIVRYREFLGVSQKVLAKYIGVDPSIVEHREKCKSKPIKKLLVKLDCFFLHSLLNQSFKNSSISLHKK